MGSTTVYMKQLANELADRPLSLVIIETSLFIVIALTAIVGNSCVLYVFYRTSSLRNRGTSYYLIVLAVSDVLMPLLVISFNTACCALGRDAMAGYKAGQAVGFVGYWLMYGSLQTTTLIAVNRFFCVVKPRIYRKYFKKKYIAVMIGGVWVISLLFVVVCLLCGDASFEFHPGTLLYFLTSRNQTINRVFAALSQFSFGVVPLSITCVCYWKVHKVVKEHKTAVSPNLITNLNSLLTKEEIHITRSVLVLVCGFAVCWIPCSMVHHVSVYIDLPRRVLLVIPYTAHFSSAINPIVYYIFNKPFRKHFSKAFSRSSQRVRDMRQPTCGSNNIRPNFIAIQSIENCGNEVNE